MTYRNDLDAAHARIESLERENERLIGEKVRLVDNNARLRAMQQSVATEKRASISDRVYHVPLVVIVAFLALFTLGLAFGVAKGGG